MHHTYQTPDTHPGTSKTQVKGQPRGQVRKGGREHTNSTCSKKVNVNGEPKKESDAAYVLCEKERGARSTPAT